jgi:rubredoxin
MRTIFDPPADPFGNEPETSDANGDWCCPKCGHTRRTYRGENDDNAYCVKDGKPMIWNPDERPEV